MMCHRLLRHFLLLLLLLLLIIETGCGARRIIRMSDGQDVEMERLVSELKGARVVLIGETHDVVAHHRLQFDVIDALFRAGVPLAIGLEMFPAASQRDLDQWVEGRIDTGSFRGVFKDNWTQEWGLYREIFLYARDKQIPMVGLNIPKEIMRKVYSKGFAALSAAERLGLPAEISCDASDPYTGLIQKAYVGHTRELGPFSNFCEAQTLWNKGMAHSIVDYLQAHPGRVMVVLAGVGHAMKQGIPAQIGTYGDYPIKVIIPMAGGFFPAGVSSMETDFFVEE